MYFVHTYGHIYADIESMDSLGPLGVSSRTLGSHRSILREVCVCVCVYTHIHQHALPPPSKNKPDATWQTTHLFICLSKITPHVTNFPALHRSANFPPSSPNANKQTVHTPSERTTTRLHAACAHLAVRVFANVYTDVKNIRVMSHLHMLLLLTRERAGPGSIDTATLLIHTQNPRDSNVITDMHAKDYIRRICSHEYIGINLPDI